jgi:hypothetical protein
MPEAAPQGEKPAAVSTAAAVTADGKPIEKLSAGEILRLGLWNYISMRWAPKNTAGRWAFDIGVLVVIFGIPAVLYVILTR